MKAFLFFVLHFFFATFLYCQSKVDTLTNDKVIQLSKIGLQPSVIINKIQSCVCIFDVSTDGLINLSTSGVSPDVINEMMKKDDLQKSSLTEKKDMKDPKTIRSSGIYYYNPLDSINPLKKVDATVTSSSRSGGSIGRALTYGLASEKIKSSLAGKQSRLKIDSRTPIFYFYFDKQKNYENSNWFFASAATPNEFVLAKLSQNRDSREMTIASENDYGSSVGIPNNIKIDFEYTEEADGVYKVFFKKPLANGEYCFVYASATPSGFSNDKVFDFSIQIK